MDCRSYHAILIAALMATTAPTAAGQATHTDPSTGAQSWQTHAGGVSFSLKQLLPEQLLAFYLNRGFRREQIEDYARSCVYMTVLRNESAKPSVHFKSSEWVVETDGQQRAPTSTQGWLGSLRSAGASPSAMIAFRWAQFPAEQTYEPGGDWNQGMLSMGLPSRSIFTIRARWQVDGRTREAILENVRCAE